MKCKIRDVIDGIEIWINVDFVIPLIYDTRFNGSQWYRYMGRRKLSGIDKNQTIIKLSFLSQMLIELNEI